MKTVLIITQKFPPFNGVGVLRVTKFVKYIQDFGWRPVVLTCKRSENHLDAVDEKLLDGIPEDLSIYRVNAPSLYDFYRLIGGRAKQGSFSLSKNPLASLIRSLFVPDQYVAWYFTGVRKAREIFQVENIDAIYSTSPRETSHLIGRTLHLKYKRPWIADFRDPWIEKQHRPKRIQPLEQFEKYLQKIVLRDSDRILAAWPGILRSFEPDIEGKSQVLTNGFDEEDFKDLTPHVFSKFTFLYAGSLFKELSPLPMFEALGVLLRTCPKLRQKIQLVLLGRQDAFTRDTIKKYELEPCVHIISQIPHRECLQYILGAEVLTFSVPDKQWIPSKIFEYLRANRPILAIADQDSDAVQIIERVNPGFCFASRDPGQIACHISNLVQNRQISDCKMQNNRRLWAFERKQLAKQLAHTLDILVNQV